MLNARVKQLIIMIVLMAKVTWCDYDARARPSRSSSVVIAAAIVRSASPHVLWHQGDNQGAAAFLHPRLPKQSGASLGEIVMSLDAEVGAS